MTPLAVLAISGSDSSAGTGVQADLKVFAAMRLYGASVATAVTSQNTRGVQDVFPMPGNVVAGQLSRARRHADQRGEGRHAGDRGGGRRGDREGALRRAAQPGHRPGAVVVAGRRAGVSTALERLLPYAVGGHPQPRGGVGPGRLAGLHAGRHGRRGGADRLERARSTWSSPAATWSRATRRSTRCGPTRAPGSCATRGCSPATATAPAARSRRPSPPGWPWATRCRRRWSTPRSTWPGRCSRAGLEARRRPRAARPLRVADLLGSAQDYPVTPCRSSGAARTAASGAGRRRAVVPPARAR